MSINRWSASIFLLAVLLFFADATHAAPPLPALDSESREQLNACVGAATTAFIDAQAVYPEYQEFQSQFTVCNTKPQLEISACYGAVSVRYQRWQETLPEFKEYQRQSLLCYGGTPYEVLLPPCARPGATVQCPDPVAAQKYLDELGYGPYLEQAAKTQTALTSEQSQKLVTCLWDTTWRAVERREQASEKVYEAYAACYEGLPGFEGVVATHKYSVNVVACARATYGGSYLRSLVERGALPTAAETATLKKCAEAAAVGGVAIAAANTLFGVGPVNLLLYGQFLLTQPVVYFEMRRRRKWGVVVNAFKNMPIDLATVRLFKAGRLERTRVTDRQGRYLFLAEAGAYTLEAGKAGYRFPVAVAVEGYRGGALHIKEKNEVVRARVPLEPVVKEAAPRGARLKRFGKLAHVFFAVAAPTLGVVAFIISRTWWVGALALVQIVLVLIVRRFAERSPKVAGHVRDGKGNPIPKVIVRIFTLPWNKLAETQVTDRRGRYAFLVGSGEYVITAAKQGFHSAEFTGLRVGEGAVQVIAPEIKLE